MPWPVYLGSSDWIVGLELDWIVGLECARSVLKFCADFLCADQVDSNKSQFPSFSTLSKTQQLLTCCSHLAHVAFCTRNCEQGEKVEVVLVGADQALQLPYLTTLLTDLGALDCCRFHTRIHFGAGGWLRTDSSVLAAIDSAADAVRLQQVARLPESEKQKLLPIAQQRKQYKGSDDAAAAQGAHMLTSALEKCGEAGVRVGMEGAEGTVAKLSAVVKIALQKALKKAHAECAEWAASANVDGGGAAGGGGTHAQ
eukprot:SAG25_NODE_3773_length_974_cov_1.581714_1_plen_254_part_10